MQMHPPSASACACVCVSARVFTEKRADELTFGNLSLSAKRASAVT